jgi:hypothetical protein
MLRVSLITSVTKESWKLLWVVDNSLESKQNFNY